jgi:hypothetical protein
MGTALLDYVEYFKRREDRCEWTVQEGWQRFLITRDRPSVRRHRSASESFDYRR